jgi:hypothetical protein
VLTAKLSDRTFATNAKTSNRVVLMMATMMKATIRGLA